MDKDELLDELFEKSGGFSRYQVFTFIVFQSCLSCYSFWFYGLGFLLQEPTYKCEFTQPVSDPDDVCTAENICSHDPRIESS